MLPGHGLVHFRHAHLMQLHHVQELHRRPYSPWWNVWLNSGAVQITAKAARRHDCHRRLF
jgi:hypothetical protein